ncbi:helitron_like_N domain-containing protein [Trichonephila clavipes]|nr:helitron_like_N domain-containing protein [Trichonephila clavipes]
MDSQHSLAAPTYSSRHQHSKAHLKFQKIFFENDFGHSCDIYDRLWFAKDIKNFVNNDTTPNIQFLRTMLKNVNVTEVKVCSTCLKAINKNSVPLLSVYNGFKYPPFPQHLKNFPLDLVTERLISPSARIPFMQIRRLRHVLGQFGIYGQVINVPIEVNTMVNSLPRNIDDDHSITVHIKRKKIHKSNYLCGIVNKRKIKAWLQHLKDSPLYTSYGITVDDSFFNGQDDIQDEIIYDEDGDNDISEQIPIDESLVAQQQTLMWNDEMYLTIAPEKVMFLIEFQHRGSPHAHILAWLDNAPEDALGKDYSKAIDLIDSLISVSAAEASGNIKLQTHKHTFTCYKGIASKRMQKCRFDAPFMPIKTTMILTPMKDTEDGFEECKTKYKALRKKKLENYEYDNFQTFYEDNNINSDEEYVNVIRAGINRPKVFPKRQPHEKWHNPFNPFIMNIVQSNTDFQFITEEYSCAAYVVEYINKTNRGVSNLQRKIIEVMDEHPEFDIFEITRNISINLLNHTEITSQEAAWYLLREPMSKSSTIIVYIPTVWPIERQRIKKTMMALSELDDDCTDIWKENWFDKYEKRPQELENVSLAPFVSKYYKNNKEEYVIRNEPKVIRYRNYDMATDLNEYKREMVTLHIPFRHEESEILSQMKFIKIYDENVDLILQKRKEFESNIDIEKTLEICRELCREEDADDGEDIRDVAGRLPDQNPFQELYNNPTAEINGDLLYAMLNKLGAIAKKKKI